MRGLCTWCVMIMRNKIISSFKVIYFIQLRVNWHGWNYFLFTLICEIPLFAMWASCTINVKQVMAWHPSIMRQGCEMIVCHLNRVFLILLLTYNFKWQSFFVVALSGHTSAASEENCILYDTVMKLDTSPTSGSSDEENVATSSDRILIGNDDIKMATKEDTQHMYFHS